MRGFLLLFRRDLTQRAALFIASLVMGLLIVGISYLPGSRVSPAELRGAASLVTVLIWCSILAILLGGSIFTRDLTENRLAFDFRLPVRPTAIWAARLLAALATIAFAGALVLAAPALASMDFSGAAAGFDYTLRSDFGVSSHSTLTLASVALLVLLFLSNSLALAARTRQKWAALDFLTFVALAFGIYWNWQLLRPWGLGELASLLTGAVLGATLFGAGCSALAQVHRGRTEPDKAQKSLSIGLLASALLSLAGALGFSQWLLRPNLSDLLGGDLSVAQSLGPDWLSLSGKTSRTPFFQFRFLLQPETGRWIRLGPIPAQEEVGSRVARSMDGSTIAWMETAEGAEGLQLVTMSMDSTSPLPIPSRVSPPFNSVRWALSPDGKFLAELQLAGGAFRLVVSEIASGGVATSLQFPQCNVYGDMLFAARAELLIPCGAPSPSDLWTERVAILRINLSTKEIETRDYRPYSPPALEASAGLIQARRGWLRLEKLNASEMSGRWRLLDPDTGASLVTVKLPVDLRVLQSPATGRQLVDGTIALVRSNQLFHFSTQGTTLGTIGLPAGEAWIVAESANAAGVLVAVRSGSMSYFPDPSRRAPTQLSLIFVELSTGTVSLLDDRLHAQEFGQILADRSLYFSATGRLVWFNPTTHRLQQVLENTQYPRNDDPSY